MCQVSLKIGMGVYRGYTSATNIGKYHFSIPSADGYVRTHLACTADVRTEWPRSQPTAVPYTLERNFWVFTLERMVTHMFHKPG